ncbi:hypothetical protein HRbin36_02352 [bacterium HR36]|nr:hypothetical protein HRbin36_02352 [bacterium HR36]
MDVESLAGQSPGTDIHDHGQPFAGDGVEHLLHQHQPLAGSEIGHASPGDSKTFANTGGRVFALRLEEHERIAPKILFPIHNRSIEPAAHGRGTGDRIRTRRLADVRLHMHYRFRTIAGRRNSRIFKRRFRFLFDRLRDVYFFTVEYSAHGHSFPEAGGWAIRDLPRPIDRSDLGRAEFPPVANRPGCARRGCFLPPGTIQTPCRLAEARRMVPSPSCSVKSESAGVAGASRDRYVVQKGHSASSPRVPRRYICPRGNYTVRASGSQRRKIRFANTLPSFH